MGLLVALDNSQIATGSLYWDDGITLSKSLFENSVAVYIVWLKKFLDADMQGLYSFFTFNAIYKVDQFYSL